MPGVPEVELEPDLVLVIFLLRNEGQISGEVMRRVERELDLEESRLEI